MGCTGRLYRPAGYLSIRSRHFGSQHIHLYRIQVTWYTGKYCHGTGNDSAIFHYHIGHCLFFHNFKDNPIVERIFKGIRPAVVALIAAPTFTMGRSAKINRYNLWIPGCIGATYLAIGLLAHLDYHSCRCRRLPLGKVREVER